MTLDRWRFENRFEVWITKALMERGLAGRDFFCGANTREQRAERLLSLITEHKIESSLAGRVKGEPKVWSEVFRILYGDTRVANGAKEAA